MVLSVLMDVSVPFAASLVVLTRGRCAGAVLLVQLIAGAGSTGPGAGEFPTTVQNPVSLSAQNDNVEPMTHYNDPPTCCGRGRPR